jgi:hypothetical protein
MALGMPHARAARSHKLASILIVLALLAVRGRPARADDVPCNPRLRDCTVDPRLLQWRVLTYHGKFKSVWHEVVLYRGGQPIEGTPLYDLLGRPDLAAAYQAREARRTRLDVLAGVVAVAGLAAFVGLGLGDSDCVRSYACLGGALGLAGAGFSGSMAILELANGSSLDPIPRQDLARLVADYNRALPRLGAAALPSGGALVLRGGF